MQLILQSTVCLLFHIQFLVPEIAEIFAKKIQTHVGQNLFLVCQSSAVDDFFAQESKLSYIV